MKLFDRALGDRAVEFHGVPSWLDFEHSVDPEGWHRVDFGPYQVHFPSSQQPATELRNVMASAPMAPVLELLDDSEEVAVALECAMDWIAEYDSWMLFRVVVETVSNPRRQVSAQDAQELDPAYEIDDEMAEFVAEPGEFWAVLLREAFMLPERDEPTDSGLTDEVLAAILERATTPDVHILVSEIRRLRRLLS
jgi:hypothetical protein